MSTTTTNTLISDWLNRGVVWTQRVNYALSGPGVSIVYAQYCSVVTGSGEPQTDFELGTYEAYNHK
jgi:hypothetical protein